MAQTCYLLCLVFLFHLQMILCGNKVRALDANTDREALLTFSSLLSDPQGALRGWNSSSPHCTWFGVTCSNTRVVSLRLRGLGLSGTMPPHVSNLSSLQGLDLRDNDLYGAIPRELGGLSSLGSIALGGNSFNGTLPISLSDCYNLENITLELNKLTGNIPYQFGLLPRLKLLDVSVNNLTGGIPTSFGNLSLLSTLALAQNQLSGEIPSELGNLQNLAVLQLSVNELTGEIPWSLYNISSLVYLYLTANALSGALPSHMGSDLPNLREVYLADNKLEGPLPISLFSNDKSQIQDIDLSSNAFDGPLPLLGNLSSLVYLHLGYNNLSSTTQLNALVMHSLTNCTHLEKIFLNSNQLAGDFPTSVANLSAGLLEFCIDGNMFTGAFPRGLDSYQNLTALAIQKNMFTGTFPSTLGTLRKIQKLTLQENMFSGEIPDMFDKFTQLYLLTMGGNRFSGRIPPSLAKCESLSTLGLPGNSLNGGIPKEIFGLSSLINLQLARNNLTGTLPDEVGNLKQLGTMNLQDNQLFGNIPASIGGCTSLRILSMARNRLNGSIPTSFRDLKALESLDLSSNSLSGPILKEFGNLTTLNYLNLSFNKLEGEVPGYGVFLNLTSDSLEGNDKLCSTDKDTSRKLGIGACGTKKKIDSGLLVKTLVPLCALIVLVLVASFSYLIWSVKRRRKEEPRDLEDVSSLATSNIALPKISYSELRVATNEFDEANLIGKGAFGSVYKAVLTKEGDAAITVAVKVLDLLGQSKASKSFDAECQALRNVRHRNLVKVLTSCSSTDRSGGEFKALVMELMSNGNLDKWLYESCDLNVWKRLDIAIDVASAIDYLHHGCDPPVVHCDLKPGNVLLDDDMTAHVGDFGLARFLTENEMQKGSSTAGLKGSIGYIPPEYGVSGKVSTSGDVYSFGILVLEMFIAKKPTDEIFKDGSSLIEFASAAITSDTSTSNIVDPTLFGSISCDNIVEDCVEAVMRVGLCCASYSPKDRLSIREALTLLNAIRKRTNPNKVQFQ